jgi:thiamine-monophosphate kinase
VLSVTILGVPAGLTPVTRGGAKAGDGLYVTGRLGGSILGRHMEFVPRVTEARELAGRYRITAMIDLSDGLSRDLRHICEQSGVGARVEAERVPIHEDARRLAERDRREALFHALHDGEDHELLFTSPDDVEAALATRIGVMTADGSIVIGSSGKYEPLDAQGWEHRL